MKLLTKEIKYKCDQNNDNKNIGSIPINTGNSTGNSTSNGISKTIKKIAILSAMSLLSALSFNAATFANSNVAEDKMVNVSDHNLHSMSFGEGEFTVIFESGFGSDLSHWRHVAPAISKSAKVVLYSRAGYGKSDPVTKARTLTQTTSELSAFIKASNLTPPYIFVGHSYGGHIIRTFAAQNPDDVAGLVFVDPANEAFFVKLKAYDSAKTEKFLSMYEKMVPEKLSAENKILMEIDKRGTLPDFGPLPDVPAAVITSMVQEHPQFIIHSVEGKKVWRQLHNELFNQFSNASHITTMDSGHNIALQEPTLVIEAIETVIKQASKASQQKHIGQAISKANILIKSNDLTQAEETIFAVLKKTSLASDKINTLGYQFLLPRNKANQNKPLAAIILKYNMDNNPKSANAFDSYGEALLALNKPNDAKVKFLEAIKLSNNERELKGFNANLSKAKKALKEK